MLRRKQTRKDGEEKPDSSKKPDAEAVAPAEPPTGAGSSSEETSEEKEFDLNLADDCVEWMLSAWAPKIPDEAKPVCAYFVESHLRPKVCKGQPLSLWFRKEVIDSGLLKTKDKRRQFLQTWKANRATRFCKGPQEIWAKKG